MKIAANIFVLLFAVATAIGYGIAAPSACHGLHADRAHADLAANGIVGADAIAMADHHQHDADQTAGPQDDSSPADDAGHIHVSCCTSVFALPPGAAGLLAPRSIRLSRVAVAVSKAPGELLFELLRPPRAVA